jgi:hypothetical protein
VPGKTLPPSELALLASRAAVELDEILLGHDAGLGAVHELGVHLQSKLKLAEVGPVSTKLMDPTTVVMVRRAMNASLGAVDDITQLVLRAKEMTTDVGSAVGDRGHIESARTFCVALSRIADAYGPATEDSGELHPFSS